MFSLPCTECDEMSVVSRSWNRDRPCTTDVGVAELVGHLLQVVRLEVVVVPQDVVVTRPTRALDALVRAQVEVELGGVGDAHVDGGAGGDVAWNDAATMRIIFIHTVKHLYSFHIMYLPELPHCSLGLAQKSLVWWRFCTTM